MNVNNVTSKTISGVAVRTNNADEMQPETAKIAGLWETFANQLAPKLNETSQVFGVYTNYASDHNGDYDVIAGSTSLDVTCDGSANYEIEAGKYLVFTAKGEMPQVVIQLWGEVWAYFDSADCEHERAYTTDFEAYLADDEVEIAIAIK